jgi:hypothetical protein
MDWELEYVANNTFAQVHTAASKYMFIRGSVGSGKSSGCILHCFLNALEQAPDLNGVRRSRYGILRATYPNLKSTTVESWKEWFGPTIKIVYDIPIRGSVRMNHPDGRTTVEMDLVFLALDREEDVIKLQSLQLVGAHLNETAEIPRGVFQMLKSRIDRYPKRFKVHEDYRDEFKQHEARNGKVGAVKPFIISDYNSVPTEHWLYKIAEEEKPQKHEFWTQPSALLMCARQQGFVEDAGSNWYKINPFADNLEHLSEDYYVDQVSGADPEWVSVFVLNNYGNLRGGKPVYKMYDDKAHFTDKPFEISKGIPIVIGMDTGLTPAAAFTQFTASGQFVIFDELVTEDCSIHEFAYDILWPHLRNHYKGFKFEIVLDPENKRGQTDKKTARDILVKAGLPVTLGRTNNPAERFESVVFFLRKKDGLLVTSKCPIIRKGFLSEFKYDKMSTTVQGTQWKEKVTKNIYSHVHEGVQYAAMEFVAGKIFRKNVARKQKFTRPADNTAGY